MIEIKYDTLRAEYIDSLTVLDKLCFSIPWSKKLFENDIDNKNAFYVIALFNGVVIGYCGLYKVLDEADITNIAVHPDYRNLGIATTILDYILKHCSESKISKVMLEVRESNYIAINLYKKYGFKVVGSRKNYYSDNKETAILMSKNI